MQRLVLLAIAVAVIAFIWGFWHFATTVREPAQDPPRADAELQLAMPEAHIYRYPVRTRWTDPRIWRSDVLAAVRVGAEYVKFLIIRGREALIDMTSGDAGHAKQ